MSTKIRPDCTVGKIITDCRIITLATVDYTGTINAMKHARTEMEYIKRTPVKSKRTNRFRSGFNVWLSIHKCPVCGAMRAPLSNLSRGKKFFCTGTERSNYSKPGGVAFP
jgi:hypothetical protein